MWIKNNNTGHVWEILDEKQIKNMLSDSKFEEVDEPKDAVKSNTKDDTKKTSKRNNPNQTKTMECEECGKQCKGQRSYTQHRRMAHGITKDGDK